MTTESFTRSNHGFYIESAHKFRGGALDSLIFPTAWCSVVLDEPDTTHANETTVATESATTANGDKSKIIMAFPAGDGDTDRKRLLGLITITRQSWAQSWNAKGFDGNATIGVLQTNIRVTATNITNSFDVTELTWNNHASKITTGGNVFFKNRFWFNANVRNVSRFLNLDRTGDTGTLLDFPIIADNTLNSTGLLIEVKSVDSQSIQTVFYLEPELDV